MSARRIRIVAFIAILWNFLEGAPTLSVTTPGEYGEMWTLTCNDATYALGGAYNWFKDGSTIFTQAGEKVTTGKYTKEESAGSFKLLIHNLTIADYGIYKCNHNFTESANTNFTVQASAKKDNTVAKRDKDKHLEITLKIVYPAFTFAAVTYKAQQIPGSFKASVANGDRYDMIWRSTSPVDIAEKNPELSIVLTGGYTTQTLANIAIDLGTTTSSTSTAIHITSPTSATSTHLFTPKTSSSTSTSTTSSRTTNSAVPTQIVAQSEQDESKMVVIVVPSVVGGLFVIGVAVTVALVWKFIKNKTLHNNRSNHHKEGPSKKENKERHVKRRPKYPEYIPSHHHGFSAKELYGYTIYSGQSEIKRNPLYYHNLARHMNMSFVTNRGQYHINQLYNGNQFLGYQMPSARTDPLYTRRGHMIHPMHRYLYPTNSRALRTNDNTIVPDYSWNWN